MNPVDIWTKAIDMTLAASRDVPDDLKLDARRARREPLRHPADAPHRERHRGPDAAELAKARAAAGGAS